jgi:hypothetical protein
MEDTSSDAHTLPLEVLPTDSLPRLRLRCIKGGSGMQLKIGEGRAAKVHRVPTAIEARMPMAARVLGVDEAAIPAMLRDRLLNQDGAGHFCVRTRRVHCTSPPLTPISKCSPLTRSVARCVPHLRRVLRLHRLPRGCQWQRGRAARAGKFYRVRPLPARPPGALERPRPQAPARRRLLLGRAGDGTLPRAGRRGRTRC